MFAQFMFIGFAVVLKGTNTLKITSNVLFTCLIVMLVFTQAILGFVEFLETRKLQKANWNKDAGAARQLECDRMYDIAMVKGKHGSAQIAAVQEDVRVNRRKLVAQMEATAEALMTRAGTT